METKYYSRELYHGFGIPTSIIYSRNYWNGDALCVGDSEGFVSLYRVSRDENNVLFGELPPGNIQRQDERIFSKKFHDGSVSDLKFQIIGMNSKEVERYLYSSSTDSFLVKYDLEHEQESCKLKAHREWVKKFALSVNSSSLIATVGNDGDLRIYDDRQIHPKNSYLVVKRCQMNTSYSKKRLYRDSGFQKPQKSTNSVDDRYFTKIERIQVTPKIELSRIHEQPNRKSISREKLISNKSISVSGVAFLSERNYLATCGSTDGLVKVWDLRKVSNKGSENSCIFRFGPQRDEDGYRGIIWMDVDEKNKNLVLQTRRGTIHVYSISGILSCCENLETFTIDVNKIFNQREEIHLLDPSQKPSISGDGDWLVTASNSGSRICVFDISKNSGNEVPYYVCGSPNEGIPEFQCFGWERKMGSEGGRDVDFPLEDGNWHFQKTKCVGRERYLNFSVGTKSRHLRIFVNREFQAKFRKSVMPCFSGVSAGGELADSRTSDTSEGRKKLGSKWVSGESFSLSGPFDGEMDVTNQLSLSSSLSVPFPKPNRSSIAMGTGLLSNPKEGIYRNQELPSEASKEFLDLRNEKKTGFLTLGGMSFSERDSLGPGEEHLLERPTPTSESVEKTPFRRSIPFMGSSQDSVGYPAPQRGQSSYMTQSQESLLTPNSPEKPGSVNRDDFSRETLSNNSSEFSARKIIHIPLSQSNEEMATSPGIERVGILEIEQFKNSEVPTFGLETPGSLDKGLDNTMREEGGYEGSGKGFKQRRLDSWLRVNKGSEIGSTTNCSTAELSPVS
ncbi:denticleless protein [Cryptosporidium felis]|nr:denticleless protein [Cryptosporidium felis]